MIASFPAVGLAAVAGLALGSFAVTSGLRLSQGQLALAGRSRCDGCGRTLGFAETVPLLSFLQRRGVCATCRARIDPTHLAGEVGGALVIVTSLLAGDALRGALLAVLGLILIATVTVDWKAKRLPDAFSLLLAALGASLAWLRSPEALLTGGIAALTALLLLGGLRWLTRGRGGEPGLGLGDVKLVAALALWLGAATP